MKKTIILFSICIALTFVACSQTAKIDNKVAPLEEKKGKFPVSKTEAEWKKILDPLSFEIMVKEGTEPPYKNPYHDNHKKGIYISAATGEPLFSSDDKFDSGTGWPSFTKPINSTEVIWIKDNSYGMSRDEVIESKTGLHLGHVFNDGPAPTGLRYCINSAALKFVASK